MKIADKTANEEPMNPFHSQDNLNLQVRNFGPVCEANIELRPLTVFVGPSNTGKSYLAILIYALHQVFNDSDQRQQRSIFPRFFMRSKVENQSVAALNTLVKLAKTIVADKSTTKTDEVVILPDSIAGIIQSSLGGNSDVLEQELCRCFGFNSIDALIRNKCGGELKIKFWGCGSGKSRPVQHTLTIKPKNGKSQPKSNLELETNISKGALRISSKREKEFFLHFIEEVRVFGNLGDDILARRLMLHLMHQVWPQIAGPLNRSAFYLPADRTGVMHAHQVVVSALIESASMAGLRPAVRTPLLSGVLADFLEQLIELHSPPYRRRKSGDKDHGAQIEAAILGGAVKINKTKSGGYPHFTYRPEGWNNDLSLMNASTMVSELAPVVLYLRHAVGPGDMLIVEEPESHLHPAMQVEFTRQIAALVQAGIRVIVTTHSEWVLDELSNIVRRFETFEVGKKDNTDIKIRLPADQVGVWLFNQGSQPNCSKVEEIKLDHDTGIYPADYDKVSEALYNESVSIFNRHQDNTQDA